ncbi:MAG: DUF4932 domain-containing protein [Candidatus Aminicenantes bacterium]|jgi:hypothetical protein
MIGFWPKKKLAKFPVILICICLISIACSSDPDDRDKPTDKNPGIPIRVDSRIELFSTIHRLAGTNQYVSNDLPGYIQDVEEYFAPFRNLGAVKLAIALRKSHNLDGNSPMAIAAYLTDPPSLDERAPLIPPPYDLDRRWTPDAISIFLDAARDFARKTDFMSFFDAHRPLYIRATQNLRLTLENTDLISWFQDYFGYQPDDYVIIIGLQNGTCNYGSSVTLEEGRREFNSLLGANRPDKSGAPQYPSSVIPIIVHEFCHSYVNPLIDRHVEKFQKAGMAIFPHLEQKLRRWGYNHWYVMVYEYVVRACVIRYVHAQEGEKAARNKILEDERAGFLGIAELVELLVDYENRRDEYPDMEAFLPRIIAYFEQYASTFK